MKKTTILYWTTTVIIFLFEGVMPAFTSQTELAKEGIRHLGYPAYFGILLTVYKVLGTLAIVLPQVPSRIKEWAYAGLAFDFISAFISLAVVDGIHASTFFPLVIFVLLIVSYITYHQKKAQLSHLRQRSSFSSSALPA
ncbi:MAG TPA: DoxX family protein [Flavisolibacter sp.]|jgi:hypothetical protein|nr:DoxX family protein [Flavisolibacter sp.]